MLKYLTLAATIVLAGCDTPQITSCESTAETREIKRQGQPCIRIGGSQSMIDSCGQVTVMPLKVRPDMRPDYVQRKYLCKYDDGRTRAVWRKESTPNRP